MRFERTATMRLFCICLRDRSVLKRYAEAVGLGEFHALGRLAVKILVHSLVRNGNVVAVTPHRVAALVRECGLDRSATRTVSRAIKSYLRSLGIYPTFNNYVYRLADLVKAF
ncbi:MAG: hypothetical protein QXP31_10465 [Pyrobaculum sp.]|jgi:hypothetical protein